MSSPPAAGSDPRAPDRDPAPGGGARAPGAGPALPLLAAALTLAVRGLVALSRLDEQELELYSGSLAWALLQGMPLDPEALPVIPHNRGSVVFGVLLVPLFALLGPTLGAIKVLAVAASAATAALFTGLLQRAAGRVAALVGALGYALLPPSFQMVDAIALASHGDSLLLTLASLALVLRWAPALTWMRAALLGLWVGFACFFSFQCLVAVPALVLAGVRADRAFWRRPQLLAALAAACAWIPLAAWMVPSGEGATIVDQSVEDRVLPDGVGGALHKLGATLALQLRASWLFELHGGAWASWLFLAAVLAGGALVVAGRRRSQPIVLFFLVYPALVLGAYAATNFRMKLDENLDGMGSRYLMPALPFLVGWVALACRGLLDRGRRAAALLLGSAPLVAGAPGVLALVDLAPVRGQPPVRGTELPNFHGHLEHAGGDDLAARLAWVERVDPDWPELRPLAHRSFARPGWSAAGPRDLLREVDALAALPPPVRRYAAAELGRALAAAEAAPADVSPRAATAPHETGTWLLRGYGAELLGRLVAQVARRRAADPDGTATFSAFARRAEVFPEAQLREVLWGMGAQLGFRLTPYQPTLLRVVRGSRVLEGERARAFHRAAGSGYRLRFRETEYAPPTALRVEDHLTPDQRASFGEGLAET